MRPGLKKRPKPIRKPRLPVKPVRTGFGSGRFQTGPNLKFKFELKMKKFQKIPKNISSCDESNGVKFCFKYSFIQYTLQAFEFTQKNVHTKVYKYNIKHVIHCINVKVVKKGLEGSFRLKHVIQTFIQYILRAFEFKQKNKFGRLPLKPTGNRSNRSANRWKPVESPFLV